MMGTRHPCSRFANHFPQDTSTAYSSTRFLGKISVRAPLPLEEKSSAANPINTPPHPALDSFSICRRPLCGSSPPPPASAANFLFIALPGSPLRRCYSCSFARKARTLPPPTPPPLPRLQPQPTKTSSTSMDGSCRDLEATQSSSTAFMCQHTRPPPPEGRRASSVRRASAAVVAEVVLAACAGSALDLDHFVAAGSLRLSRAMDLAGRPWGHCVAALVVAVRKSPSGWK